MNKDACHNLKELSAAIACEEEVTKELLVAAYTEAEEIANELAERKENIYPAEYIRDCLTSRAVRNGLRGRE